MRKIVHQHTTDTHWILWNWAQRILPEWYWEWCTGRGRAKQEESFNASYAFVLCSDAPNHLKTDTDRNTLPEPKSCSSKRWTVFYLLTRRTKSFLIQFFFQFLLFIDVHIFYFFAVLKSECENNLTFAVRVGFNTV